jgi:hypothetical protein
VLEREHSATGPRDTATAGTRSARRGVASSRT